MQDFTYAIRVLRKSPGFALIAVLALALGIGANTAIFSVVNAVFLRPLPYDDSARLVELNENSGGGEMPVSYPNYLDWKKQAAAFEDMASNANFDATLTGGARPERIAVGYVSSGFFRILRVKPALGRDFGPDDDHAGATPAALLTHELWQTRYSGNAGVIGSTLNLDRRAYTIIGVLPRGFRYHRPAQAYVPISDALTRQVMNERGNHNNNWVIARLKPGVTLEHARAEMGTISSRLQHEHPDVNTAVRAEVFPLRQKIAGGSKTAVLMLLGAVGLVLLIACVNVANLLLARAAGRRKEMAIRAALGASRARVLRQLLAESILLAFAAAAAGLVLAQWSFSALVRLVPASIAAGGLTIDGRVLLFTAAVALMTGVLFGLAPAIDASRLDLSGAMRDGTRTSGSSGRGRMRDALVVAEVALALVLLVGAGLLVRTLNELMHVRLGFDTARILTIGVNLPDSNETTPVKASLFFEKLIERVQAMPGVESAAGVNLIPLGGANANIVLYRNDRPLPPRGELPSADNKVASPAYFRTMGIPLIRGRIYTATDGRITDFPRDRAMEWLIKAKFSVVINEEMARRNWPGEDPVGKTFRAGFPEWGGPDVTVVGVVGNTRDRGPDSTPWPAFYWSSYQFPFVGMSLTVRTHNENPMGLAAAIRRAASELDANALISDTVTMEQLVSDSVASRRLNMLMLGIFAGLALVLAAVGIYGVMAYSVNQRRREIGVRMAMGAASGDVLRLVVRKAAVLGGLGVALGSVAAFALTRFIAAMLYGVKAVDPLTFASVAALLFAVAILASYAPARRAAKLDPLEALRCE